MLNFEIWIGGKKTICLIQMKPQFFWEIYVEVYNFNHTNIVTDTDQLEFFVKNVLGDKCL